MAFLAGQGGLCMCTFGMMPTPLNIMPLNMVTGATPLGSITDFAPFVNVVPFGMCMSLLNPTTAALTAAAFGVLTPGPCIPTPVSPWVPGCMKVMMKCGPALDSTSKLMCAYGGCISIISPGCFNVIG